MSASGRAWGWHRLVDEWAARIVADARVRPGELVVDVGAGHGALTGHLLAAGARLIAADLVLRRAVPPGAARRLGRARDSPPVGSPP